MLRIPDPPAEPEDISQAPVAALESDAASFSLLTTEVLPFTMDALGHEEAMLAGLSAIAYRRIQ